MRKKLNKDPFYTAVMNKKHKVLKKLLHETDKDINEPRYNGDALLHLAVSVNDAKAVKLLLDYGADPNVQSMKDGLTPLHCATVFGKYGVAEMLIKGKADLDFRSPQGSTPLHIAAYSADIYYMHFIAKSGGSLLLKDSRNKNPLEIIMDAEICDIELFNIQQLQIFEEVTKKSPGYVPKMPLPDIKRIIHCGKQEGKEAAYKDSEVLSLEKISNKSIEVIKEQEYMISNNKDTNLCIRGC